MAGSVPDFNDCGEQLSAGSVSSADDAHIFFNKFIFMDFEFNWNFNSDFVTNLILTKIVKFARRHSS